MRYEEFRIRRLIALLTSSFRILHSSFPEHDAYNLPVDPARSDYDDAVIVAQAAYDTAMIPVDAAFDDAINDAIADFDSTMSPFNDDYDSDVADALDDYESDVDFAEGVYRGLVDPAYVDPAYLDYTSAVDDADDQFTLDPMAAMDDEQTSTTAAAGEMLLLMQAMSQFPTDMLDAAAAWVTTESGAWSIFFGIEVPAHNEFVNAEVTARGIAQGLIDGALTVWLGA